MRISDCVCCSRIAAAVLLSLLCSLMLRTEVDLVLLNHLNMPTFSSCSQSIMRLSALASVVCLPDSHEARLDLCKTSTWAQPLGALRHA